MTLNMNSHRPRQSTGFAQRNDGIPLIKGMSNKKNMMVKNKRMKQCLKLIANEARPF